MNASLLGPWLAVAVAACSGAAAVGPAGRYAGSATPVTPGPLCRPSKAVAQIRNNVVIFVPDEGTWTLEGLANPDGTLTADRSAPGANRQPYDTSLEARWSSNNIDGVYKTPRCTFRVALTK